MSGRLKLVVVVVPLTVVAATVAAVSLLGRSVGVVSPKHLTPEVYARIRAGDTREQVDQLLPRPRPPQVSETVQTGAGGANVVLVWKEFGVSSTYGTFVEFRITFQDGRVVSKEQSGPER